MNKWNISFYSARVEKETLSFPDGILADFIRIGEMIEKHGPNLGKPHTDSLGNKLFEIRAKAKEGIGRSLFGYAIEKTNEIVILFTRINLATRAHKHLAS
ncbi:MAG: hypothetical protein QG567_403 [Campylobacterota bacterium]|nr:hypothetical protein [Campylobacterota bacterium]MDQ1339252.1 hypothetical protein [Campylobacterota bacterium]